MQYSILLMHGSGAGHSSRFMSDWVQLLETAGLKVHRLTFPYMQEIERSGRKRPPERFNVLCDFVEEQVLELAKTNEPLLLAGKSLGGRVAMACRDLAGVKGAVAFGYPFHPPAKPLQVRMAPLVECSAPGLILQGERDPFGKVAEVQAYTLPSCVSVQWLAGADHDFTTLRSFGQSQHQVLETATSAMLQWMATLK
ncbi:alpha/beta hydrolase [Pokkaliibacter plantistimulans]|uniref:Alpha/beta hydrolase n=1 Tax=Proteobacteria bacterium 228 TaxID=2083153 RepID=A0A2S5KR84_9PROT|nr:alpha/beta family hydrolase [Pokkaliibacter plantistimulans]PPC77213.1 alpha/beta hydrolase [Pokkaliibacter plantistimulans]